MKIKNYITAFGLGLATLIPYKANTQEELPQFAPVFKSMKELVTEQGGVYEGLTIDYPFVGAYNIGLSQQGNIEGLYTLDNLPAFVNFKPDPPHDSYTVIGNVYDGDYGNDT